MATTPGTARADVGLSWGRARSEGTRTVGLGVACGADELAVRGYAQILGYLRREGTEGAQQRACALAAAPLVVAREFRQEWTRIAPTWCLRRYS